MGDHGGWTPRLLVIQCGRLRNIGLSGPALADALMSLNRARFRPPKPDDDGGPGPALTVSANAGPFPEPEDRGLAVRSGQGGVEYVEDFLRPGRIMVVAGEEGTGKTFAIDQELGIRVAVAGRSFAGTWPVLQTGTVLVLSEMHPDDDHDREEMVLSALGISRERLTGRYFRLPLLTAAGSEPPLMVEGWRSWVTRWLRDHGAAVLVVDTATGATNVDPWGRDIQGVYRSLRLMLDELPTLSIVLLLHMKKPTGKGVRGLSDVMGEWGRWCDTVLLMQNEGNSLERVRLTLRKRVRKERRVIVTKANGLLIGPVDPDTKGPKVPTDRVVEAVAAQEGITYKQLGKILDVSADTAKRYVADCGDRLVVRPGTAKSGAGAAHRVYIAASPHIAADEGASMQAPMGEVSSPHRRIASIDAAVRASTDEGDLVDLARGIFGDLAEAS